MATSRGPAPAEPGTFSSSRRPSFVPPSPGGSSEPSSPYVSPVAVRRRQGALTLDTLDPEIMSTLTLPPPAPPRRRGAVSGASGPALPFPSLGRPDARRGMAARSRGPSPQGSSADGSAPQPSQDLGPTSLAPISLPDRSRSGTLPSGSGNGAFPRSPITFPPASSFYENPAPGNGDGRSSTHDGLSFYAASSVSGPGPSASIPASWTDLRRGSRGSAPPLDGMVGPSGAHSILDGLPSSSAAAPPSSYVSSSSSAAYAPHPAYSVAQHTSGMPGYASSSPPHPSAALTHGANATFGLARPWAPSMTSGPDGREIMHANSSYMPGGNARQEEQRYYDVNKPKPRSGPRVDNDVPRNFRCQYAGCPARFQRNHDLKRHQRGHLATRPFACTCGKSFSRKDALKRHMLVKGCGGNSSRRDDSDNESPKRGGNKRDSGNAKRKGQNQQQQQNHDDGGGRSDDDMEEGDYDENEDELGYSGRDRATSGASQTSWHQQQQRGPHSRVVSAPNHGHDGASLSPASVPRNVAAPELLLESWNDASHPGMARTSSSDTTRPVSNSSDARSLVSPGLMHAPPPSAANNAYAPPAYASYKSNAPQSQLQRSAYSYANVDARNPVEESDAVYLGAMDGSVMSGAALARRESTTGLFFQQPRAMQ